MVDGRDATLALEQEETVFPACIVPMELYGELISSYSATSVVDLSPGQGEFLKACLAARTKSLAVVHTESHAKHLELLCTDFVLSELSREGSTFFRPETAAKDEEEESEAEKSKKTKKEKKAKDSDKKPPKRKQEDEGSDEKKPPKKKEKKTKEEENTEKKSTKTKDTKQKKTKTKKEESDAEEGSDTSSAMW